ncbi:beta/gamma crystallin domain-containing protein 2 [Sorex fumeus]|uniref:beta/gamma crystallin domain-containing protein 2 n=1 Tax=Sorex fumeus TaxID=62283 RepID=UPI0024AD836E|nr:beta/gamma crystallin domain-containing protein 2 [Sorex fumeus]
MEEAGGPPARAEARVVSATLMWRQRSPAQDEVRHHFHKVSLVSGTRADTSREELLSHRREEVNGFAVWEEETAAYQASRDGAASKNFQSHGPIFSKKFAPLPKEKRPPGRPGEAVDRVDGRVQEARTESSSAASLARTELLVPLPGPREPSPHPGGSLLSGSRREERRVTRTVRTTVVMGGQVERRVSSSVTSVSPAAEALPRGRNTVRAVRAVVVNPSSEGVPSRSQALQLLSSLVPAERGSPVGRHAGLPAARPGQLPERGTAESKDNSSRPSAGTPEGSRPTQDREIPIARPHRDPSKSSDPAASEASRVPGAAQPHLAAPFSPRFPHRPLSLGLAQPPEQLAVFPHSRPQFTLEPRAPQALSSGGREGLTDSSAATEVPTMKDKPSALPGRPLAPSPTGSQALPSPGGLSAPSSPRDKAIKDLENIPIFSVTEEEEVQSSAAPPAAASLEDKASPSQEDASAPEGDKASPSREGASAPEGDKAEKVHPDSEDREKVHPDSEDREKVHPAAELEVPLEILPGFPDASASQSTPLVQCTDGRPSIPKEDVLAVQVSLTPSLTKEETVQDLPAQAIPAPTQEKVVQDSAPSPQAPAAPFSIPRVVVQGPDDDLPVSPSLVDELLPSPGGSSAPVPVDVQPSLGDWPVSDCPESKMLQEPSREEEELVLAADMESFLDTLRRMEPPEILRTHRLPRAPRSSYLTRYATLPAIEEDQLGPWVLGPGPQEAPELEEKEQEEEVEEEEPENPYLSDDEKLQRRQEKTEHQQEKTESRPLWESRPARRSETSCSPLEMLKKHVASAKGAQAEPGMEWQAGSRPTSRLGGSILFGNLVPTTRDTPALEPLGTKLSALPPHKAPGLRKVPGQLPLLYNEEPPAEKPDSARPPEGWHPALKTQSKLNTRPGKVILFSEAGCRGSSKEVWDDVADASSWAHVASVRVVRGCWVLYEEPEFQGQKLVLPEGEVELRALGSAWRTQGIGSLRRAVRDYLTPRISLYSEEGLMGEQVILTETLETLRHLERPLKVASASVAAGLWLLYPKPCFEGTPCILEPGEYPTSKAWGASDHSVGSLKPMTLGCPSVEKPGEPKAVVYEAPDFQGQSWEVSRDIYNLRQPEDSQSPHLTSVGSLRILGGCWVGYEKEGFRGHQYLLEEGEYADWSHWGGYDEVLTSLRVIRTDFGDPAVVLFEAMDFEGHSVEVSEALPDVELEGHCPHTQAIHVLSGVWVAYQEVGFSGEQYVLEKGVYRNCDDWGSGNSALASLQPVLQVGEHNLHYVSKIQLFSGPDFLGDHISFEDDQTSLPLSFHPQSCRVQGGSWILFDQDNFEGEQHILSEGEFPTLTAMGCSASTVLGSLRKVPLHFSEPSIFLYGLECFEGKEIELSREVRSLQAEGFNNHVLSVRIKGGSWVLCEHSDFRGRQWLVSSCEITNWLTYSGTQRVGSLYPIKQRRAYFRLWNEALGGFLAMPDHVEDMKAGRVVVSEPQAGGSCIWYYEEGLLKNQMAPTMSLQVIGPPSLGSKVVLWAESRVPRQTWSISELGHICSQMFEGRILDVKGGRGYDRDHVVLWEPTKDRPSQIWTVHVL